MSYVILGRAIKNEYLAIGTLATTGLISFAATRGGKKEDRAVDPAKSKIDNVKDSVPINAGSSEEEQFITNYIKEAEEGKH